MGPGIIVLIWIGMAIVGVGIFLYALAAEKKRREAVQKLAADMGLEYRESLGAKDDGEFGKFQLAGKGRGRKSSNVIVADSGELRMVIFDYQFTTGSGKSKNTHRQTVVFTRSQTLQLPEFSIGPESFLHKLGDFFGMSDIDFEDDPEFSKQFLLHGPDEDAVRAFFDSERRKRFLQFQGLSVEGQSNRFIFFQNRQRHEAEKLKQLMEQAFELYKFLS